MEKFFIVPKENSLYTTYSNYLDNMAEVNKVVKGFMADHGIEADQYYVNSEYFYIVPTENDKVKFGNCLAKAISNGLQHFKKTSKIGKAWKALKVTVLHKPMLGFYFKSAYGRHRTRIFKVGDTVYCSLEGDYDNIEPNETMIEIKASEFHAIIEAISK